MTNSTSQVSEGLQITYLPIEDAVGRWGDAGHVAWRVAYGWQGKLFAHPVPFVRRRDAERALKVLEETGYFFGSPKEIVSRIAASGLGSRDIRRMMIDALEW